MVNGTRKMTLPTPLMLIPMSRPLQPMPKPKDPDCLAGLVSPCD